MGEEAKELKRELREFGKEKIEVIFRQAMPPEFAPQFFPPLNPGMSVEDGICVERDVAVPIRDGTIIYTDIYRPEGSRNLPAIIAWSPYGKSKDFLRWAKAPGLQLVGKGLPPADTVSSLAKFEGPDPAYWCHYGYAVINPDPCGINNSQGDISLWSTAEARQCYDLIEWVAARDWSNGRVGMAGNGYLAIMQWFAAAEKPPHLTCIAPWSGFYDVYRYVACVGGIPELGFTELMTALQIGRRGVEDLLAMVREYPLMNGYWEDKLAKVENIEIPIYATSNYNLFHSGGMDAFRRVPSQNKWLRIENTHEWVDSYVPQNLDDLRRFFDRYLKGIRNGWEYTPRVRVSVYDPGGVDQVNRPENEWPLARTQPKKLFLDAAKGTLSPNPVTKEAMVRYKAEGKGQTAFTIRFDEDTELVGYWKLRLWVEAEGADDMDLIVSVRKLDKQGNLLSIPFYDQPHLGRSGMLRVSHRELDEIRSTPSEPFLTHRRKQLLSPREIVPVEIPLWPLGMFWRAGEQLSVVVADNQYLDSPPHPLKDMAAHLAKSLRPDMINRGEHIIHTGGKFDSHLLVPLIPNEGAVAQYHQSIGDDLGRGKGLGTSSCYIPRVRAQRMVGPAWRERGAMKGP